MIRAATHHDIDAVLTLYKMLFSEIAAIDPERSKAAEHQGAVSGFCLAGINSTPDYHCLVPRRYGYIFYLIVSPEYCGNKASQQLLREMKLWATEQQLTHIELSVFAKNSAAIHFYQREGFKTDNSSNGNYIIKYKNKVFYL